MSINKIQVVPVKEIHEKRDTDVTSKIFIITLLLMGVNKTGVFRLRRIVSFILTAYSMFIACITIFFNIKRQVESLDSSYTIIVYTSAAQYILGFTFDLFTCKKLDAYYSMLNKFDLETGFRPNNSYKAIRKIIETFVTLLLFAAVYYASHVLDFVVVTLPLDIICIQSAQLTEFFYVAHLLDLTLLRIRRINFYLESSLNLSSKHHVQEYVHFDNTKQEAVSMKKIMDLYQIIVVAFETLNNSFKWQILMVITFSFFGTLSFSFQVALVIINGTRNICGALVNIGLLVVLLSTIFALCNSCDAVHKEALRLRELLAMKLYNNKLDKSSRSVARALLALTETRDLTFSLMNMFTVDQSLPFTLTALLVTYLIILLQFNKVLNN